MWKYRHSVIDNPKSGYNWSATGLCYWHADAGVHGLLMRLKSSQV